MIVWLASYPRSGNTFLRIVLHRLFGVTSSTVYEIDGVAQRLGDDVVGAGRRALSYDDMRADESLHWVKTHRPFDDTIHNDDRVIHLVRDGRDAVVSWARQRAEGDGPTYQEELNRLVDRPESTGAGGWGTNVLSWSGAGHEAKALLHFHQLIVDPERAVAAALRDIGVSLPVVSGQGVPSFAHLNAIDPAFFRVGRIGSHQREMPADVHHRFCRNKANRTALDLLGYAI